MYSTKERATRRKIGGPDGLLANRRPFEGNSMRAVAGAVTSVGHLPEPYAGQYKRLADAGQIAYTVISYATPIAWVTTGGTVIVPDVRYSVTTLRQQGQCGAWLR